MAGLVVSIEREREVSHRFPRPPEPCRSRCRTQRADQAVNTRMTYSSASTTETSRKRKRCKEVKTRRGREGPEVRAEEVRPPLRPADQSSRNSSPPPLLAPSMPFTALNPLRPPSYLTIFNTNLLPLLPHLTSSSATGRAPPLP